MDTVKQSDLAKKKGGRPSRLRRSAHLKLIDEVLLNRGTLEGARTEIGRQVGEMYSVATLHRRRRGLEKTRHLLIDKKKGERPSRLRRSSHLKLVDEVLLNRRTLEDARAEIGRQVGETYSVATLHRRRRGLEQAQRLLTDVEEGGKGHSDAVDALVVGMKTLGEEIESVATLTLDPDDPMFHAIRIFRSDLDSPIRRAKELYEPVDFQGYTNYILNVMQLRIANMFETELLTGAITRDNTANMKAAMRMIDTSIQIHLSLGVRPKFGNPATNKATNADKSKESEQLSEQSRKLRTITEEISKAETSEEREALRKRWWEVFDSGIGQQS